MRTANATGAKRGKIGLYQAKTGGRAQIGLKWPGLQGIAPPAGHPQPRPVPPD
jgi:hypothetical protein